MTSRVLCAVIVFVVSGFAQQVFADSLAKIHQRILKEYEGVEHLSADQFIALSSSGVVLFDVREEKEYRVSHLDNAIQVSPGISAEEFFAAHADKLTGKTAVFYCSVGHRSSKLVRRLETDASDAQNMNLFNLEGGIFRWVNDDRELDGGVHPNNWLRARLIEDKDKIRYKPVAQP